MSPEPGVAPLPPGRRRWMLYAATVAGSMTVLDMLVVSVALPTLQSDLDLTRIEQQWVINAYLLLAAMFLPVAGRLADMFDRELLFIIGVAAFFGGSLAAAVALDGQMLLAARGAQGLGAALLTPVSLALLVNAYPKEERGKAVGITLGVMMLFATTAPLIGGGLAEIDWRLIFVINLPLAAFAIFAVRVARPDARVLQRLPMDWPGAVLLVAGLGLLVGGLMQSPVWGWTSPATLFCVLGGLAFIVAFVFVELRRTAPLLELRLFKGVSFLADNIVLALVQFSLMGLTVFGAIYVQNLLGFTPFQAGLSLLPVTAPLVLVSIFSGGWYARLGPRPMAIGGALLGGVGMAAFAAVLGEFDYWLLFPGYVCLGAGLGLVMGPLNTDALSASPPELRGQASGLIQSMRQAGGTLGLAAMAAIIAASEVVLLSNRLRDLGFSNLSEESTAKLTSKTPSEQAELLSIVPVDRRPAVIDAARDSLAEAISIGFWSSAAVMVGCAVLAAFLFKRTPGEEPDPEHAVTAATAHPVSVGSLPRGDDR